MGVTHVDVVGAEASEGTPRRQFLYSLAVGGAVTITRIDRLLENELIEWWAGVYGFRLTGTAVLSNEPLRPVNVRSVIESLFRTHVVPAAIVAFADEAQRAALRTATIASPWQVVPDVDVLIDPLAAAVLIAQLTDGPFTSREALDDAVWASM